MLKTCVAFVTYNKYNSFDWTKVCVKSFRNVFDHSIPLIAVDHNRNPQELNFLKNNQVTVVENKSRGLTHGAGLDIATDYARDQGYDAIFFAEPDCLFTSDVWYEEILKSLESGKSMAACHKHDYGPLHPCGSGWIIKDIPHSFSGCMKNIEEVCNENFRNLIDNVTLCKKIINSNYNNNQCYFFLYEWDVGIRNWYTLACQNKTAEVSSKGLHHFWFSHQVDLFTRLNDNSLHGKEMINEIKKILSVDIKAF
jgi:hypothetical protein